MANNVCFLSPASKEADDGIGDTVEVEVIDSKTGPGRHAAFVSGTYGKCAIRGEKIVRQWLHVAGIALEKTVEGGFYVERPNYFVVRVNLSAMSKLEVSTFIKDVEAATLPLIVEQATAIKKYVKERYYSATSSDELRYVNLSGGTKFGNEMSEGLTDVMGWAWAVGVGKHTLVVPGPLIRATLGKKLTHMPLATGSTYTHLVTAMKEAHAISEKMSEPDVEFDLQGAKEPKFGNHSLRRQADKVARETLPWHEAEGYPVTKEVIDYFFGWLLKERRKDMQLLYAGMDKFARRILARVSMFL